MDHSNPPSLSFFFGGNAWGCIYIVGVYAALVEHFSLEEFKGMKWGGVSSGALIALGAALHKPLEDLEGMYNFLANIAEAHGVFGKMSIYHEVVLSKWLPDGGDEYKLLQGRFFVGVTRPWYQNELVSEFRTNEELKDIIHASMHIPFYMTHMAPIRGGWAIDGGFVKNIAKIDGRTVTVGVDRATRDIHPAAKFSLMQIFFPASAAERVVLAGMGKTDALAWLRINEPRSKGATTPSSFLPSPTRALECAAWDGRNDPEEPAVLAVIGWVFRIFEEYPWTFAVLGSLESRVLCRSRGGDLVASLVLCSE